MMRVVLAASLAGFTACPIIGQSTATPAPAFDVASIKVSQIGKAGGEGSRRENVNSSPGSLTMRNVSLSSCIRWAYNVKQFQVSGPAWLESERYDVLAKAGDPASTDQLRLMLQALLANRFKLTLHREEKVMPTYVLVVAKNGPKFHQSEGEGKSSLKGSKAGVVNAEKTSMTQLADILAQPLRCPITDMTGLKGLYDFTVDLTSYIPTEFKPGDPPPDIVGIAMSVLQDQLGLKLEAKKVPVEILIVDHADKVPSEN
jgi:uncharacterized protein (TIGR03435 family)